MNINETSKGIRGFIQRHRRVLAAGVFFCACAVALLSFALRREGPSDRHAGFQRGGLDSYPAGDPAGAIPSSDDGPRTIDELPRPGSDDGAIQTGTITTTDSAGPSDEFEIPDAPAIKPAFDGKNFILLTAMTYRIGTTKDSIVVPAGFVTDFASVPPRLQSFVSPLDRNMLPAIVHDYLYWSRGCTQDEADRIFELAMRETGVSKNTRGTIMLGLGVGSKAAYAQNRREREAGYIRVVPNAYRTIPRATTWPQYRQNLRNQQVKNDTEPKVSARFCAWGRPGRLPPGVPR